jgi:predicted regulator of Ras-like GTPase activity (Roadblock/LC7/MglB family)
MSEIENIIDELLNEEQNIYGVAVIGKDGSLLTQTDNWDISGDLGKINELIAAEDGIGRIEVQGIRYMVVENTPERKIGTNVAGKGHIIICPVPVGGSGALVCYINPQVGPRDALFNAQDFAKQLVDII